jgi:1-acyl-sn-glycerol-3-phosphate acyltransferase
LDSVLDKDLGFDSLVRMELLSRLERAFQATLPEQVLMTAETPRDLLQALRTASPARRPPRPAETIPRAAGEAEPVPSGAQTLLDVLDWHVLAHPNRTHVHLYGEDDAAEPISYAALFHGAQIIANGLVERGLEPGRSVALMLPTGRAYLQSFFGVLYAGGVPVPVYPPARPSQIEDHLRRHARLLDNAGAAILITVREAQAAARWLKAQVPGLSMIVMPEELTVSAATAPHPGVHGDDTALLQYTSGSTGDPKGVVLNHAQMLANIRAMGEATRASPADVFVSWLPLYHDMGLIGAWLGSLYYGCTLALMSPLAFLARPQRWLWAIHRHRATLSAGPNFAYEVSQRKVQERDIEGLDLSSWRIAFNGAEAVSPHTMQRFAARFAPYGFRKEAMMPVYGLAECAVGLAFPPPGRGPLVDRVQREPFAAGGMVLRASAHDGGALEFVSCGQPLPGHEIRIVDDAGRELPERREGHLQFRGPSATRGYFRNPQATAELFDGDWLHSGDRAYVAAGEVYLTGRTKDIIIRAGRNIYPEQTEEAIGDITGIRKGCVAVFGSTDPATATERAIVLAETRETDARTLETLRVRINAVATELWGTPPDEVALVPPHTVLKTSSGKLRRSACRALYEQGRLGRRAPVWWQVTRLALSGVPPQLRRQWRGASDWLFAVYGRAAFWCLAPPVWLLVALTPRMAWRWRAMRRGARLLAWLTRTPLHVEGLEHAPRDRACVLVANHASYLDGMVMVAALPIEFSFVAKAELRAEFVSRVFLRRIRARFVERFDARQSVADARELEQALRSGDSLMIFPEGTFTRAPGVRPFFMGAFSAAAQAGVPVIPVTLRGTRSILRSDQWFVHRGAVRVRIGAPLAAQGTDWAAAVKLRDAARAEILRHAGEPDLIAATPATAADASDSRQ